MNLDSPEDRSVAAGEYVLGTLDGEARAAFIEALANDSALAAEVYAWQDRLLGLARRVAPSEPDAQCWPEIEARLSPAPASRSANDPQWRRVRLWQTVSGLALAASVLFASLLVLRGPPAAEPARYLAVLQAPDKSAGWVVEASVGGHVRLVALSPIAPVPAGKALQFWTKAKSATAPTSLGLIRLGEVIDLPGSRLPTLEEGQLFELTLEPETGSPIGRPTGPVLFVGRTVRL